MVGKLHCLNIVAMTFRQDRKGTAAKKKSFTAAAVVQTSLDSYFGNTRHSNSASNKRVLPYSSSSLDDPKRYISTVRNLLSSKSASAFGTCPICHNANIPIHRLALHASLCNGKEQQQQEPQPQQNIQALTSSQSSIDERPSTLQHQSSIKDTKFEVPCGETVPSSINYLSLFKLSTEAEKSEVTAFNDPVPLPYTEPLSGLYVFENFLTEYEEDQILMQLGSSNKKMDFYSMKHNIDTDSTIATNNSWKAASFNGNHYGQRWGVHCNLRTRQVLPEERPLPKFYFDFILPKLQKLGESSSNKISTIFKGYVPNEMNAIEYHKSLGHSLSAHVDDRHLSKEVILNMSLAGDCYMTFTPVEKPRASSLLHTSKPKETVRVLLQRRCLQILTGPARYQYTHGIHHRDLLNERRVSLTLRESPITRKCTTNSVSTRTTSISTAKARDYKQEVKTQNRQPQETRKTSIIVAKRPSSITSLSWIKPVLVESSCHHSPSVSIGKAITSQVSLDVPPGLYIFPNFITQQQERELMRQLDKTDSIPQWSIERHTGTHREKRWGVDHDIWSRQVREPIHTIPHWIDSIIIQRLKLLRIHSQTEENTSKNQTENSVEEKFSKMMQAFGPNDVNAIEYKRDSGHFLGAHIDDRQKHTEPIANLSLAGDCYMEYTLDPIKKKSNRSVQRRDVKSVKKIDSKGPTCTDNETEMKDIYRVHLPRRTLQILTGRVRYDYRHGIHNSDLSSERRISITLRETRP